MAHDVVDLREFYRSRLGQVARRMISRRIRRIWPDLTGERVLAIGYGTPYLAQFRDEAERVLAVMPAMQGVVHWPQDAPCLAALADEAELPLSDRSIDRILLVHGLEFTEQLRPLLRELWRVLADGGRLLAVVPNRRGIWARLERTPFGHGHPYSPPQLAQLLRDSMFQPTQSMTALYLPPTASRMALRVAEPWERLGERWGLPFAGVLLVEAGKEVAVATTSRLPRSRMRRRRYLPIPATQSAAQRLPPPLSGG